MAIALAFVIGLVAVTLTAVIHQNSKPADAHRVVAAGAITGQSPVSDYRFMEMNLDLPSGTVMASGDIWNRLLELDRNLYPRVAESSTAPDWRLMELNQWGENFIFDSAGNDAAAPLDTRPLTDH
jgi:hypothetical protein